MKSKNYTPFQKSNIKSLNTLKIIDPKKEIKIKGGGVEEVPEDQA